MSHYLPHVESIDNEQKALNQILINWAKINSGSENLAGLSNMLKELKSAFTILKGKQEIISLIPRKKIDSLGNLIEVPTGKALRIRKHPKAKIQVCLGGHYDTVYPKNTPFTQSKLIDTNILQGPGVADMKGGLLIMLKALEMLEKSPCAGQLGWEVIINPDEEVGSVGSEHLFIEAAARNQLGLLFEPSFADGAIVNSRKGSANYVIVARGLSAHSGRDFHLGRNAISAIARFVMEVETLTKIEEGITINVGHIEGGGPVNIVPDLAICKLNLRVLTENDLIHIKQCIQSIVDTMNGENGITLSLYEETMRLPKPFDAKNQALFESMKVCAQEIGVNMEYRHSGGVCDGNILSSHGIPAIDTLGAIGGKIHTFEEFIYLNSLVDRSKLTALFLMQLATNKIELETATKMSL